MAEEEVLKGLEASRRKGVDRMRDNACFILAQILKKRMVSIEELADESGLCSRTIYRWVESLSFQFPITINGGVVYVADNFDLQRLHQAKLFSEPEKKLKAF